MHFQSMTEKKFLSLVYNALATRKTFPPKTLVTIGCNLYCTILTSMASQSLVRRLIFSSKAFVGLQDVLKTSWRHVSKKSWKHVLKKSWRQTKCLLGISVSNHGLLTNLNQYLTNLYLTNLYFTNLRRIQNVLIRTQ